MSVESFADSARERAMTLFLLVRCSPYRRTTPASIGEARESAKGSMAHSRRLTRAPDEAILASALQGGDAGTGAGKRDPLSLVC
jgi:hypothetical protein